jgi:hypothetical protein
MNLMPLAELEDDFCYEHVDAVTVIRTGYFTCVLGQLDDVTLCSVYLITDGQHRAHTPYLTVHDSC